MAAVVRALAALVDPEMHLSCAAPRAVMEAFLSPSLCDCSHLSVFSPADGINFSSPSGNVQRKVRVDLKSVMNPVS